MKNDQKTLHSESPGWLVNAATVKVNRIMLKALEPLDLTQVQFAIMKALAEGDNITQIEIGKVVSMPGYAMSRNLDVLEQKGLLVRKIDEHSRRSFRICLTRKGRDISPKLFAITNSVNKEFLKGLNKNEIEQLTSLLKKILA